MRRHLPYTILPDLRKDYDCVSHHILQDMLDERLPSTLSVMFRPLLWSMTLKTKKERSRNFVRMLVGVPQGNYPSPHLFNIFIVSSSEWTQTQGKAWPHFSWKTCFAGSLVYIKARDRKPGNIMDWGTPNGIDSKKSPLPCSCHSKSKWEPKRWIRRNMWPTSEYRLDQTDWRTTNSDGG